MINDFSRSKNIRYRRPNSQITPKAICPVCFRNYASAESLKNHFQNEEKGSRKSIQQDKDFVIFKFIIDEETAEKIRSMGWEVIVKRELVQTVTRKIERLEEMKIEGEDMKIDGIVEESGKNEAEDES